VGRGPRGREEKEGKREGGYCREGIRGEEVPECPNLTGLPAVYSLTPQLG